MTSSACDVQPRCKFCCVSCGHPIDALFKKYASSVLKIMKCSSCGEVADPYIECETIIVVIDLILVKRTAYRHVLYNTDFRIRWKLIVVLLLLESYILSNQKQTQNPDANMPSEQLFYFCFLLSVIDKVLLVALLRALSLDFRPNEHTMHRNHLHFLGNIVKSITLASITRFFLLPIVVWHSNTTELGVQWHEALVSCYFLIALTQIYSVLVNRTKFVSMILVAMALALKSVASEEARRVMDL